MLKEIQDLVVKFEGQNPGIAVRVAVASSDIRVSAFGKGDSSYHTAVKAEWATLAKLEEMMTLAVGKVGSGV